MPMSQSVLADELAKMTPTDQESVAIQRLVDAYGKFASDAMSLTPILPAGVELGKTAMKAALTGMSAPGAGLVSIPTSIVAFWGAVAGGLAASFAAATVIVPPPNAALPAAFPAVMVANTVGSLSRAASTAAMAAGMYADAIIGGTTTTPPAVVTPIL